MTKKFLYLLLLAIILLTGCGKKSEEIEKTVVNINKKTTDTDTYAFDIKPGQSLYELMIKSKLTNMQVAKYTYELGQYVDVSSIQPGDSLIIVRSKNKEDSLSIIYKPDVITAHILGINNEKYNYERKTLPVERKMRFLTGTVKNNLNNSLLSLGLEQGVKQVVNNALESEISFQTDARNGDFFYVLIEDRYFKGIKLPRSRVIYTAYSGKRTKFHEAFRFRDSDESSAYNGMYTPEGKTLLQNAVRAPLNSLHVTSPFGYRLHPIYGRRIHHNGIDYRGSRGTPVYAVSSGKVVSAGRNGGYGNEVRIKHSNMTSQYAHLSRIYVRRGQRVTKGTKIGAVGSTGNSTGPHLHFGLKQRGKWINPKRLKMVGALKLKGDRKKEYNKQIENIRDMLHEQLTPYAVPLLMS